MLSHSHVLGNEDVPLLDTTIGQALHAAAQQWPQQEAVVCLQSGARFTYETLYETCNTIAENLLADGFRPGDRIGIWAPNGIEWILSQYATAIAGIILVNVNPAYRQSELEYALNKVQCNGLILADRFKTSCYPEILMSLSPELKQAAVSELQLTHLPHLRRVFSIGAPPCNAFTPFSNLLRPSNDTAPQLLNETVSGLGANDPINIQFTSGTTGAPKGATLTHRNILNNGFFTARILSFGLSDRVCLPVPLYHCFGMVLGNLACLTSGATVVLPSAGFDPATALAAVQDESCTALYGVPAMFSAILEHEDFRTTNVASLRTGIMAGAPCPVELMKRVVDELHMPQVTIGYGMTETSPLSFQSALDEPFEARVSTVGTIHPHVEVKVVNSAGDIQPVGEPGELLTRGYSVMSGYWDDEDRTNEAISQDGWMHTGDLATIDAQGYCKIVGRIKDMIIRGGENIYPAEIEDFLYKHSGVSEVAVFGLPDEKYGEIVAAWVVPRSGCDLTPSDLQAFCKDQIAHFKIPETIRIVDDFPRTVTGKIQKFMMRKSMLEGSKVFRSTC